MRPWSSYYWPTYVFGMFLWSLCRPSRGQGLLRQCLPVGAVPRRVIFLGSLLSTSWPLDLFVSLSPLIWHSRTCRPTFSFQPCLATDLTDMRHSTFCNSLVEQPYALFQDELWHTVFVQRLSKDKQAVIPGLLVFNSLYLCVYKSLHLLTRITPNISSLNTWGSKSWILLIAVISVVKIWRSRL